MTSFQRNEQFSSKKFAIRLKNRPSGKISLGWLKLLHWRETQFAMEAGSGTAGTRTRDGGTRATSGLYPVKWTIVLPDGSTTTSSAK